MNKDLIINSTREGVEIAFLEDKNLVELHQENANKVYNVGDIFLAKVRKIVPSLNAAFIDVGYEKDAFLHYTDLGPQIRTVNNFIKQVRKGKWNSSKLDKFKFEPEIVKTGKIDNVLTKGQELLVQILKEPISAKGPRLSCELAIPGRYIVLTPFNDTVGVSKKIDSADERKRLHRLIESIRPKNFGVIVRTAAQNKSVADLHEDLTNLMSKWEKIFEALPDAQPPEKVLNELDRISTLLRDMLNGSYNKIMVDDKTLAEDLKSYIGKIQPEKANIVQHFASDRPIFDHYNITKQIKSSFGKKVTLPSGVYIIIEHTEALHVVDVNSGNRFSPKESQEENALKVNLEAAKEISRQLRLRDLGGIIVVDFVDMKSADHRKVLYKAMVEEMEYDRAQHTILPLTKFNLMQITRQRTRPEINITTSEVCPACHGTGKIAASILLTDEIKNNLDFILDKNHLKGVKVCVHPFVEAYLKKGLLSKQVEWSMEFKKWIQITSSSDYQLVEYHFFNKDDEEIVLE